MPRRPKSGPPYTDEPEDPYVVVTNPWGMNSTPRLRAQADFNRIASWAQLVLQEAGLGGGDIATIECIYSMGTRNEIIIQFAAGTNIIPLLGEHRWANFATRRSNREDATCVFLYNWRNNGDPANHNWNENFPVGLPLDTVPAKRPYPSPSWTSPPSTLASFVQSIPRPPILPPVSHREISQPQEQQVTTPLPPSPECPQQKDQLEAEENHVAQDPLTESTNLFTPYQRPLQHPSHAKLHHQPSRDDGSSKASTSPPKFTKKLDPYEMDEDALKMLRAPDADQEETKVRAPIGPPASSDYRPSAALAAEINAFLQLTPETGPSSPEARIKREYTEDAITSLASQTAPPASSGYRPSVKLETEVNAFLGHTIVTAASTSAIAIKREPRDDVLLAAVPSDSNYRPSRELEAEVNAFLDRTTPPASSSSAAVGIQRARAQDLVTPPASPSRPRYQPSSELEAEVNAYLGRQAPPASSSSDTAIKRERIHVSLGPPDSSGYRPSAALEAEINAFLEHTTAPVAVVKREYEAEGTASLGKRKRIKAEKF